MPTACKALRFHPQHCGKRKKNPPQSRKQLRKTAGTAPVKRAPVCRLYVLASYSVGGRGVETGQSSRDHGPPSRLTCLPCPAPPPALHTRVSPSCQSGNSSHTSFSPGLSQSQDNPRLTPEFRASKCGESEAQIAVFPRSHKTSGRLDLQPLGQCLEIGGSPFLLVRSRMEFFSIWF